MKYRSSLPQLPPAASRPMATGGGSDSLYPSHYGESRFSHGESQYADSGSSFGDSEFGFEPPPKRTVAGPVESWHDSSYVLRRGLEVREISAREWRLWVSEPAPPTAPRRRVNGNGEP
ncbi:hypothetical protein FHT39_004494 [Mitsuaria sp. BK045]|uniref:hypothetical protein n=1 Tax=unclassified Roseateles TaxID=2626991 RepID=UPI00161C5ED7|nr:MULTISPECIES: hypothetical protein [unclassified Roseateles]MBB3295814.1 hypothetical protein [Mitsuaria sp. BK041]MBB3365030.1 hypothetical protein [Mitsuaria sp. BK045]